jgi:hypothetical protein
MADNKLNFTKAALENLPIPSASKRSYYYDTKTRGLGISITGAGTKSFIVYRWVNDKPERVTLGRFPIFQLNRRAVKQRKLMRRLPKVKIPMINAVRIALK